MIPAGAPAEKTQLLPAMKLVRRTQRSGFSLAELMVVVVIIGLLATLVLRNVIRNLAEANDVKAKADIGTILGALDEYAISNGSRYPDSLEALVTPDEKGHAYLTNESVPKDPWGNEYQYDPPGPGQVKPLVYSLGRDGVRGGEGEDADISSADLRK